MPDGHIFCYKGLDDRKERGVGLLINKNLAGSIVEFFSINERVVGIIIRLNKRYKLKVLQDYAPTSTHSYEEVDLFYEDVEEAMKKHNTHFSIVMGDFNAKIEMKNYGESAVGHFGTGTRNGRGDQLIEFAERNRLRITNTFFHKKHTKNGPGRAQMERQKMKLILFLLEIRTW